MPMDESWLIWIDYGYAPMQRDKAPMTRENAEARVAEMRKENPKWRFAIVQIRQTPMPDDFS